MAITYPLSIPTTIGVGEITLRAVNAVGMSESPFTFRQQLVKHPGERWEAEIKIPPVKSDLAEEWVAFLLSLSGRYGTFLMGDPLRTTPRGTAADTPGTPVVFGGSQTGSILAIDGLPLSETGYLLPGDYIQLGSSTTATLHKVLTQVNTDGSGQASLDIWPAIVTAPSDNATVTLTSPVGRFRLADNVSEWSINNINSYGISFSAIGISAY